MSLLNRPFTFSNALDYRKNTPDYFVFLLFFFYGTGINAFTNTDISLVIMAGFGFLYMHFSRQERIDNIFWYVLLYWILINFLSWVFVGSENFSFFTLGGSIFKLFIGYVFMKLYKEKFIVWYEQTVFFLALVSLLFFAVQLLNQDIFSKIPFNLVDERRGVEGHWYGRINYVFNQFLPESYFIWNFLYLQVFAFRETHLDRSVYPLYINSVQPSICW